jgi:hypothetical protein
MLKVSFFCRDNNGFCVQGVSYAADQYYCDLTRHAWVSFVMMRSVRPGPGSLLFHGLAEGVKNIDMTH